MWTLLTASHTNVDMQVQLATLLKARGADVHHSNGVSFLHLQSNFIHLKIFD